MTTFEDGIGYELLLNTARDMIFIHAFSPAGDHGPFFEVNDAACQTLGYSREELAALTPVDLVDPDAPTGPTNPEDRKILDDRKVLLHEKTLLSKTGRRIPVEINSRLFEKEGRTYALSIARDITERQVQGILPICSYCHAICDDAGVWNRLEAYISAHSEAMFSHGVCPGCLEKAKADLS
jgi:PAS domain S-box-containing protein